MIRLRDLLLRAHVWVVAACIPLLVRVVALGAVLRLITPPRAWRPWRGVTVGRITELVRRRLARPAHMKRRACLREGLMLFHFLSLAGLPATLHVAVLSAGNDAGRPLAHCWVSSAGRPLGEPPTGPSAEMITHPNAYERKS